ncbi:DsbA family protein [Qipengyuania sediminis]|uniref:DsbA family protein n=1 Tax=Qipengyuania sediminis TaxID=1532023 RepID=UPI001059320D|nr:DsbA family protein [Qipengyuania sediminis]
MRRNFLTALLALACGFAGAGLWSVSGLDNARTRAWLVANPEVLPEMAAALQRNEAQVRLAEVGDAVARPFPGAVLGNPAGKRVLVMFTDYACGYCRSSERDVARLIAADPDLKVVIREWAIFPGSENAARMALAAAQQGRYAAFHKAMFAGGAPNAEGVARAARAAGLDMARASAFAASDRAAAELARTTQFARTLGFAGTPGWIAEGQVIEGAVGYDRLKAALDGSEAA